MCLIVHKPIGKSWNTDVIRSAAYANPDGIGLLWIDPESGSIRTKKVVPKSHDKAAKIAEYMANQIGEDTEAALHLRLRTHGRIDLSNVHPFVSVCGKSALMHNGIISEYAPSKGSNESDTAVFAKLSAFPLLDLVNTEEELVDVATLLESEAGRSNRLLVAREGFSLRTLGDWTEHEGLSYSNGYHLPTYRHWWTMPAMRPAKERNQLAAQYGLAYDAIDDLDPGTLWDFADLSYEQLRSYVRRNPDEVTELIFAHLDEWSEYTDTQTAYMDTMHGHASEDSDDWTIDV